MLSVLRERIHCTYLQGRDAVAGTANGKACWLDLQRGVLTADLYCRPLGKPMVCQLPASACAGHCTILLHATVGEVMANNSSAAAEIL